MPQVFSSVNPLKQFFHFSSLLHFHRHRTSFTASLPHSSATTTTIFSIFPRFSPHFLSPRCFFISMEGIMFRVVWTFYFILIIIFCGVDNCNPADYDITLHTSPTVFDTQNQNLTVPNLEAMWFESIDKRFWTGSAINKNEAMVEHLKSYGIITSKRVAEVMEAIDRALFVPDGKPPYVDSPMEIGYNATISAPHMHAACLQLLEEHLQPGMSALDVGSGTGYLTACFALMVGPQGRVVGVEHIPELVSSSIQNIRKSAAAPLLENGFLSVHVGDGRQGWAEFAPYDAIHVGAAAPKIPEALIEQLKPGGKMVIPVGNIFQDLQIVEKNLDGSVSVHSETSVRYVPLTSQEAQLRGY